MNLDRLVKIYQYIEGFAPEVVGNCMEAKVLRVIERDPDSFKGDEANHPAAFTRLLMGRGATSDIRDENLPWKKWRHLFADKLIEFGARLHVARTGDDDVLEPEDSFGVLSTMKSLAYSKGRIESYHREEDLPAGTELSMTYYMGALNLLAARAMEPSITQGFFLARKGVELYAKQLEDFANPTNFLEHGFNTVAEFQGIENIRVPSVAYALTVHRVVADLVDLAEKCGVMLKFTWNEKRQSIDVVTVDDDESLFFKLRDDPALAQEIRDGNDWWLEKNNGGYRVVIPTAPLRHFKAWGKLASQAWPALVEADGLIKRATQGPSVGEKEIARLLELIEGVVVIEQRVKALRQQTRGDHTQEALVINEFAGKFSNKIFTLSHLHQLIRSGGGKFDYDRFRKGIDRVARSHGSSPASIFQRISGALEKAATNLEITSVKPLPEIVPQDLLGTNKLFDYLVLSAAQVAGGGVEIALTFGWDEQRSEVVIENPDGRFASHLESVIRNPHLYPEYMRSIPDLAVRVAPPDMADVVRAHMVVGNVINLPIQLAASGSSICL